MEKLVQQHRAPTPHLYGLVSPLLGVSLPLLKERTQMSGLTWVTIERRWGVSWKISVLEAQIHELQGKTIKNGVFPRKIADPVSCGTFPRAEGLILLLIVGTSDTYLQELSSKTIARTARALPTERWMKGTTGLYRTVWIQWPGSSDPQQ